MDPNRPYDEIIEKRKAGGDMVMKKHTAANAKYCEKVIDNLQSAGLRSIADWAIWMLWWRMMDWETAKQVDEMRLEEIASLLDRIEQLEQEKRGTGTADSRASAVDEANAKLISAAPDLLEACKRYLDAMDRYGHPDKTDRLMQAAIEKATGKEVV